MFRWLWVLLAAVGGFGVGAGLVNALTRDRGPDGVVVVWVTYPGADAHAVYRDVARPIEAELETLPDVRRTVMSSGEGGTYVLVITFAPGADLDRAHATVGNVLAALEPTLPEAVRAGGVRIMKSSDTTPVWKHGYLDGR